MVTTSITDSGFAVQWIKYPNIKAKACPLFVAVILLPLLFALSLPRSEPSYAIADDSRYVLPNTSRHSHR